MSLGKKTTLIQATSARTIFLREVQHGKKMVLDRTLLNT
jgi:hypothetical protein